MNKNLHILMLLLCGTLLADWHPRLTPSPKTPERQIALPRQATVLVTSPDGQGWIQTGVIRLSFAATKRSWFSLLETDGWKMTSSIDLAKQERKYHELCMFRRGPAKIMLMLWEDSPADTGFSWGIDQWPES